MVFRAPNHAGQHVATDVNGRPKWRLSRRYGLMQLDRSANPATFSFVSNPSGGQSQIKDKRLIAIDWWEDQKGQCQLYQTSPSLERKRPCRWPAGRAGIVNAYCDACRGDFQAQSGSRRITFAGHITSPGFQNPRILGTSTILRAVLPQLCCARMQQAAVSTDKK